MSAPVSPSQPSTTKAWLTDALVDRLRNPNFAKSSTFAESYMREAAARIEELEALLEFWIYDGRLQTFEDRERFRKDVHAALPQPTAKPVRRCKHDVSEDCPACAEETVASLKIQLKDWQDSSEAYRADCERGNAALRKTEAALSKVVGWLGRLATASEQRAKDNRFPSLADANAADAKNYRSTIVSIMPALEAARAALPSSTPARGEKES